MEDTGIPVEESFDDLDNNLADLDAMFKDGEFDAAQIEGMDVEVLATIDDPHYAFSTKDLVGIVSVLKVIQSAGSNLYDNSVMLSRVSDDSPDYVFEFCTLGIYYKARLRSNSPSPENLSSRRVLLDINSMLAVCKYSSNSVVLFPKENAVFARVLGGSSVVKSYFAVEDKPYEQFRSDMAESFSNTLEVASASVLQALKVSPLVASVASAYQRVIYFDEAGSFLHTGAISAHVGVPLLKAAIQPKGVAGLRFFMKNAPVNLKVFSSKRIIGFEFNGNYLVINQVEVEFPEALRKLFVRPEFCTKVSVPVVNGICDLLAFSGSLGSMRVTLYPDGASFESVTKDGGVGSTFSSGMVEGARPLFSVTINANALKNIMSVMRGNKEVEMSVLNDQLLVFVENVMAVLSGKEN